MSNMTDSRSGFILVGKIVTGPSPRVVENHGRKEHFSQMTMVSQGNKHISLFPCPHAHSTHMHGWQGVNADFLHRKICQQMFHRVCAPLLSCKSGSIHSCIIDSMIILVRQQHRSCSPKALFHCFVIDQEQMRDRRRNATLRWDDHL